MKQRLAPAMPAELSQPVEYAYQRDPWEVPQYLPSGANRPANPAPGVFPRPPAMPLASVAAPIFDKSRFPYLTETVVAAPQASTLFLSAPSGKRVMLLMRNVSATANVYVSFGAQASTNSILRLTPNTMILFDMVIPQNDVFVFADAAAGALAYAFHDMELP